MAATVHQQKGTLAEKLAEQYLTQHGLQLITKNYRCKLGEIDLIMQDHDTIVFVEVRYRTQNNYGSAVESIGLNKQSKVIKAATIFLKQKGWLQHKTVRFDVVTLQGSLIASPELNWIKQAFY